MTRLKRGFSPSTRASFGVCVHITHTHINPQPHPHYSTCIEFTPEHNLKWQAAMRFNELPFWRAHRSHTHTPRTNHARTHQAHTRSLSRSASLLISHAHRAERAQLVWLCVLGGNVLGLTEWRIRHLRHEYVWVCVCVLSCM